MSGGADGKKEEGAEGEGAGAGAGGAAPKAGLRKWAQRSTTGPGSRGASLRGGASGSGGASGDGGTGNYTELVEQRLAAQREKEQNAGNDMEQYKKPTAKHTLHSGALETSAFIKKDKRVWEKGFAVMSGTTLFVFKNSKATVPVCLLRLERMRVDTEMEDTEGAKSDDTDRGVVLDGRDQCFEVVAVTAYYADCTLRNHHVIISAPTKEDRKDWLDQLDKAITTVTERSAFGKHVERTSRRSKSTTTRPRSHSRADGMKSGSSSSSSSSSRSKSSKKTKRSGSSGAVDGAADDAADDGGAGEDGGDKPRRTRPSRPTKDGGSSSGAAAGGSGDMGGKSGEEDWFTNTATARASGGGSGGGGGGGGDSGNESDGASSVGSRGSASSASHRARMAEVESQLPVGNDRRSKRLSLRRPGKGHSRTRSQDVAAALGMPADAGAGGSLSTSGSLAVSGAGAAAPETPAQPPVLFFSPLVAPSVAAFVLAKAILPSLRTSSVHWSWLVHTHAGSPTAGTTAAQEESAADNGDGFRPAVVRATPARDLPVYTEGGRDTVGDLAVLSRMVAAAGASAASWFPSPDNGGDASVGDRIVDVADGFGLAKEVRRLTQVAVFDLLAARVGTDREPSAPSPSAAAAGSAVSSNRDMTGTNTALPAPPPTTTTRISSCLDKLNRALDKGGDFVADTATPTIADLLVLANVEIALKLRAVTLDKYKAVAAWRERMTSTLGIAWGKVISMLKGIEASRMLAASD